MHELIPIPIPVRLPIPILSSLIPNGIDEHGELVAFLTDTMPLM